MAKFPNYYKVCVGMTTVKLEPIYKELVEVVRCVNCKHYEKCESSLIGEVWCCTGQGSARIQKNEADFCSCGERREK